jgi:hypothetical protein
VVDWRARALAAEEECATHALQHAAFQARIATLISEVERLTNSSTHAIEVAVDAALGEAARQQGGFAGRIGLEARGTGISAGRGLITKPSVAYQEEDEPDELALELALGAVPLLPGASQELNAKAVNACQGDLLTQSEVWPRGLTALRDLASAAGGTVRLYGQEVNAADLCRVAKEVVDATLDTLAAKVREQHVGTPKGHQVKRYTSCGDGCLVARGVPPAIASCSPTHAGRADDKLTSKDLYSMTPTPDPTDPQDLRTSIGEVVRRVDLDRAAGTPGRFLRENPKVAGDEGVRLAKAALAGDQAALDKFHGLAGLVLPGVTEYCEGSVVRLILSEVDEKTANLKVQNTTVRATFQATNQSGYDSTCIDAGELVAWILSPEGRAALACRGVTIPVLELRLCEARRLVLHPDQLYRFTVAPGCQLCEAEAGLTPSPPAPEILP